MNLHTTLPVYQRGIGKTVAPENIIVQNEFQVVQVLEENYPFDCQNYNQKGLFKISIHHGHNRVFFEDQVFEFCEYAILFSRPNVVYRFEPLGVQHAAYLCVFPSTFFDHFINISGYPLFDPQASPLMEITSAQMEAFAKIFMQMKKDVALDFSYKNDSLRNQVLQMVLDGLKLQPAKQLHVRESNSAIRLTAAFRELLEEQFPITDSSNNMTVRHPVEFAQALSVHVNHLNRSLKQVSGQTTTQLIADRMMKEAKMLLQDTDWNIIEIAWCLGFEDRAHFIKFFRKNSNTTPSSYRKSLLV